MAGLGGMYDTDSLTQYQLMQMLNRQRSGRQGAGNPLQPALNAMGMYAVMKQQQEMERMKQDVAPLAAAYINGDPNAGNAFYEYLKNHKNPAMRKIGETVSPDYYNKWLDANGDLGENGWLRRTELMIQSRAVPPEMREHLTKQVLDYQGSIAKTRATESEKIRMEKVKLSDKELMNLNLDKIGAEAITRVVAENQGKNLTFGDVLRRAVKEESSKKQAAIDVETSPENARKKVAYETIVGESKPITLEQASQFQIEGGQIPVGTTPAQLKGKKITKSEIGKAPTDSEKLSAGYAYRAILENERMKEFDEDIKNRSVVSQIYGRSRFTPNVMVPEYMQKREAAEANWILAILRKESGAAIPPEEMRSYRRSYFAQPGDSPSVIDQKAQARKMAEQQLIKSAGNAFNEQELDNLRQKTLATTKPQTTREEIIKELQRRGEM